MDELIRSGLTAPVKRLPAALLYDDLGSALFEAITLLPEYEVARADLRLLTAHAGDVVERLRGPLELVELGPGHGRKARLVVEHVARRQQVTPFLGVDVSAAAIAGCRKSLEQVRGVEFTAVETTFEALHRLPPRRPGHRRLVMFLGSNLSNFDRPESLRLFRAIRGALQPGDGLLLSADLEKPAALLLPAYDDALGVTAAFDKNVLVRLNREWGADFDVSSFEHEARWVPAARRIEMHLVATRACTVRIALLKLEVRFAAGESIWTESSHRFDLPALDALGLEAAFRTDTSWVDVAWPFALTLYTAT